VPKVSAHCRTRLCDRSGGEFRRVVKFARREPSAVLLAAQLAGVLLYPFMESSDVGRSLFSVVVSRLVGLLVPPRPEVD